MGKNLYFIHFKRIDDGSLKDVGSLSRVCSVIAYREYGNKTSKSA